MAANTQDSGPGRLRVALHYAFDHPDTAVEFQIPTADHGFSNRVFNIQPTGVLPSLFNATALDGGTEPTNFNPNGPCILLSGALAKLGVGLRLRGTNCVARGLIINGCQSVGISMDGSNSTGNVVSDCYLGVDPSGTFSVPNGGYGVIVSGGGRSNLIGGYTAGDRNLISGNSSSGVFLPDANTSGNVVVGSYIGLNAGGVFL